MQRSIAPFTLINVSIHHAYKLTWFSTLAESNLTSDREQLNSSSLKIYMEDNQAYGHVSSLKMEDNPAYGQFSHYQKHPPEQNSLAIVDVTSDVH